MPDLEQRLAATFPRTRTYRALLAAGGVPRSTLWAPAQRAPAQRVPGVLDRDAVLARQEERFGGMKGGVGFFGWLAATRMAVLLTPCSPRPGLFSG